MCSGLFLYFFIKELLCRALHSSFQIAPRKRNVEGNTAKRHKSVHRNSEMQKSAYKYKNMQNETHLSVPKSVQNLLHSADFGEKRNTTVTFSDSLLRLSCDKKAGIF